MKLEGIIPAMLTPLTQEQSINESVTRQLTNKLIDSGVNGIFTLGTNGEFYLFDDEDKVKIAKIIIDEVNGRVPVIVGVGGNSTEGVIRLIKKMEVIGADVLSIITPFFITPTQEEVIAHYQQIAAKTALPILLYNIPSRTGVNLEVDTVALLAKIPNIVGIKDSSGEFNNIQQYIDATKDEDFYVLAGSDALILKTLNAGGVGAVAATANAVPELVVSIYKHWLNGELAEAQKAQDKLDPLRNSFKYGTLPSVLKKSVELLGIPVGPTKMPVAELAGESLEKVKEMIKFYK